MLLQPSLKKLGQNGYVLLSVMLLIGTLGIYLAYQFSIEKISNQSWAVQKAAIEISYWFDVEQNFGTDNPGFDVQRLTLLHTQEGYYLPFGTGNQSTFGGNTLSEFNCSSLAGMTKQDLPLSLSGGDFTGLNCVGAACTLNPGYYSCGTSDLPKAQYYINVNYATLDYNPGGQSIPVGVGLMVRTPGANSKAPTQLPNNSTAHSLISLLPYSAFNMYTTSSAQVSGIGIATYAVIAPVGSTIIVANNLYSKIIDMGLVQTNSVTDNKKVKNLVCDGVNTVGQKTGTFINVNGNGTDNGVNCKKKQSTYNCYYEPPTCININTNNMKPIDPTHSDYLGCNSIDILYTPYNFYHGGGNGLAGIDSSAVFARPTKKGDSNNSSNNDAIFLGTYGVYYGASGNHFLFNQPNYQSNYLAYVVRCTKHP